MAVNGTLFGQTYDEEIVADGDASINVESSNVVVAPGTQNTTGGMTIAISGAPEVDFKVEVTDVAADAIKDIYLKAGNWGVMVPVSGINQYTDFGAKDYYTLNGSGEYVEASAYTAVPHYVLQNAVSLANDYYPIVWKLNGVDSTDHLGTIVANLTTELEAITWDHEDPITPINVNKTLTWAWKFHDSVAFDNADTVLGDLQAANPNAVVVYAASGTAPYKAAEPANYNLSIDFTMEVTITQQD